MVGGLPSPHSYVGAIGDKARPGCNIIDGHHFVVNDSIGSESSWHPMWGSDQLSSGVTTPQSKTPDSEKQEMSPPGYTAPPNDASAPMTILILPASTAQSFPMFVPYPGSDAQMPGFHPVHNYGPAPQVQWPPAHQKCPPPSPKAGAKPIHAGRGRRNRPNLTNVTYEVQQLGRGGIPITPLGQATHPAPSGYHQPTGLPPAYQGPFGH